MITEINESKILTKHISRKCEYKLNTRKCNSNQMWNNDKCRYVCKNPIEHHVWKKMIFEILLLVLVKMGDMQEVLLTIQ